MLGPFKSEDQRQVQGLAQGTDSLESSKSDIPAAMYVVSLCLRNARRPKTRQKRGNGQALQLEMVNQFGASPAVMVGGVASQGGTGGTATSCRGIDAKLIPEESQTLKPT